MIDRLRERSGDRYILAVAVIGLALLTGGAVKFLDSMSLGGNSPVERQKLAATGGSVTYNAGGAAGTDTTERKRVTRYYIDLEVPDVEAAIDETGELAERKGGRVLSSSFNREDGDTGDLEVAVPDSNVSGFLEQVESSWRVESSRKTVDDVTERYTELELELENRRQELRKLEQLMNRSDSVENTIKIQERMSELRSRIQFLENQLADLDRRVEYTNIHLSYEEPQPITHEFELRESFSHAYRGIFSSLDLMIVGLGYLLPFLVLGGIIYKGRNLWREREQPA